MVIQGPAGVHREIIPSEYSATGTYIACAATRFRESERADLGSIDERTMRTSRRKPRLFRVHVTVRQVWLRGALLLSSLSAPPVSHPVTALDASSSPSLSFL